MASPTLVNSFRIGFTRINETRLKDDFFNFCTAGIQNFWCGENKAQFGQLLIVNGFTEGVNYSDPPPDGGGSWYRSANYILNDDMNWVHGAHQFSFGGAATHGRFTSRNNFASNASSTSSDCPISFSVTPPKCKMACLTRNRCTKRS